MGCMNELFHIDKQITICFENIDIFGGHVKEINILELEAGSKIRLTQTPCSALFTCLETNKLQYMRCTNLFLFP